MSEYHITEIVLATTNHGKLKELKDMLVGRNINLRTLDEFDQVGDCEETGSTFAENARQKAQYYSKVLGLCVLADDSGLEVDALEGSPGVFSARFAGVEGPDRDKANNEKLLHSLALTPDDNRQAKFRCGLCLCTPDEVLVEVEGILEGIIAHKFTGNNGFGYDPVFYLPQFDKTVAELTPDEKNAVSHRGKALKKLMVYLETFLG